MEIFEFKEEKIYIDKIRSGNQKKNLKYHIITMGCMLNENDSEKISGMIEEMGYSKCDEPKKADLIVFNTCCIRENAEEKLFGKLGELKNYKKETGAIIACRWLHDARKAYTRKD
jgi:tRNA-2-methylthio-N6-dimethylallyladenosine synthase